MDKKKIHHNKIEKLSNNPYLNLFHMDTSTKDGKHLDYYFASRNKEEEIKIKTRALTPEGMMVYPLWKDNPGKIVMIRQYRYPLDEVIYELPAGLIEKNETSEMAAIREMKEETGLSFECYKDINPVYSRPFFMGPGFTDETSCMVYGYAKGTISQELMESSELIEVILADKQKVRQILKEERVCIRTALLLMHFLESDEKDPFAFLK